jgi:hypothetical protein
MLYKRLPGLACLILLLLFFGCLPSGKTRTPRMADDVRIFTQAQQALDVRDFDDAARLLQLFLREFPRSERYCWGLQRMGETMEGLLQHFYLRALERGQAESSARRTFLASYGSFGCWLTHSNRLSYDGSHYRRVLDEFPDSTIADESAYRLVLLDVDSNAGPEAIMQEVQGLEQVLERYPTTSLRYEILYGMAYRCHRLYELYAFSPRPGTTDREQAQQYRDQAIYLYSLAIKSPRHSLSAEKAWKNMRDLEDGRRLFP